MVRKAENIEVGSGNVFVDLGFEDAGERKLRVQLAMRLNRLIEERGLTQTASARIFGVPQPHVSDLVNFKLRRFSSERLMRFLTLLDYDVEISIHPKTSDHAKGRVSVINGGLPAGYGRFVKRHVRLKKRKAAAARKKKAL